MTALRSFLILALCALGCAGAASAPQAGADATPKETLPMTSHTPPAPGLETATLGGGCFWCVEAIFENLQGVHSVESGYSGGHVENPTYEEVCAKRTGHAEVVQVHFDPAVVSYRKVLEVFFQTHDPTTLNKQGADVGPQYRSAIFYHSDEQKKVAEEVKALAAEWWDDPIVTEVTPFTNYYAAEDYHQDYYANNPRQGYCSFVIAPKLAKFREKFKEDLKTPAGK